jgi:hypothetical protein
MRSGDQGMVWIITDSIRHAHGASQYSAWSAIMEHIIPEPKVHGIDHLAPITVHGPMSAQPTV